METQYFILILIIVLLIFLIFIWTQKTIRVFLWNYMAWFSAIISYLFVDFILNYIWTPYIKLENPDAIQGLIMNNQTIIVLLIYFIFFILFYNSQLFETNIHWLFKKIVWLLILPILTVVNCIFTILLILNGPNILTYQGYIKAIAKLNLQQEFLIQFFNLIPLIIILVPLLFLFIFIKINIKLPSLRKKKDVIEHQENSEQEIQEENK